MSFNLPQKNKNKNEFNKILALEIHYTYTLINMFYSIIMNPTEKKLIKATEES